MAYQTSDIVTKVQDNIQDSSYSASKIKNALNYTQNSVFNKYKIKFMKTSWTFTATIGNSDLTAGTGLNANHVSSSSLVCTTSGKEGKIMYIKEDDLEELYPDYTDTTLYPNAQPEYWYDDGLTVRLFPAPDVAYTYRLRGFKKPTLLSDDADVPSIPSEHEELLIEGASARILRIKDNYDQAGVHDVLYKEQLQDFVTKYTEPHGGKAIMRVNRGWNITHTIDSLHRIP